MSESLSLLSDDVGGGGGGGGGLEVGESGGVDDMVEPAEFLSTKLMLSSEVDPLSPNSGLLCICSVGVPLKFCVRRSDSCMSSIAVCGRGGAPSCVGRSKWILRKEGAV